MRELTFTRRRTIAGMGSALVASVAGCFGDESGDSGTFDHPNEIQADEPFELTIDDLPEETPLEVTVESQSGIEASVTVETDGDGRIDLARSSVVAGDVPLDLDVPTTVALVQFQSITLASSSVCFERVCQPIQADSELNEEHLINFIGNSLNDELPIKLA